MTTVGDVLIAVGATLCLIATIFMATALDRVADECKTGAPMVYQHKVYRCVEQK